MFNNILLTNSQTSTFRVGDRVKVINTDGSRNGPYLIASIPTTGVCTLSDENGETIEDGEEIEENDLEAA